MLFISKDGIGEFSGLVGIGAENLNSDDVRVRLMDGFEHAGKLRRGLSQGNVPPAMEIELMDYPQHVFLTGKNHHLIPHKT